MRKLLGSMLIIASMLFASKIWGQTVCDTLYTTSAVAPTGQTLYYKLYCDTMSDGTVRRTAALTQPFNCQFEWAGYGYYYDNSYGPLSKPSGNLTIPDSIEYDGDYYPVRSIGDGFLSCDSLTSVILPSELMGIELFGFWGCRRLQSVDIPEGIWYIDDQAFADCPALTSITMPRSVTELGRNLFSGDSSLNTVYYLCDSVPKIMGNTWLWGSHSPFRTSESAGPSTIVVGDSVRFIPDSLFCDCVTLTNLHLGTSVATIGECAFRNCTNLTAINIPKSMKTIKQNAFLGCNAIDTVNWQAEDCAYLPPAGGSNAIFSNVGTIIIGEDVKHLPSEAFHNNGLTTVDYRAIDCKLEPGTSLIKASNSVDSLIIGERVKRIPDSAFFKIHITSLTLPDSVEVVGRYAFGDALQLKRITIGRSMDSIMPFAFFSCTQLDTIFFNADSCRYMGKNEGGSVYTPFANSSMVGYGNVLVIGNNVRSIPNYSFARVDGLKVDSIPPSVKRIGTAAFWLNDHGIQHLALDSVRFLGSQSFYGCYSLSKVTIGNCLDTIGQLTFCSCPNLDTVIVQSETPAYSCCQNAFSLTNTNQKIFIPCGTLEAYRNTWGDSLNYREPEPDVSLTLTSEDEDKGTAVMVVDHISCVDSTTVVEAIAGQHYHFDHWSNGSVANPATVKVLADDTLTAYFAPNLYTLTLNSNDTTLGSVVGGGEYPYLDTVTIEAVAADHYHFSHWNDYMTGYEDNPRQFVVTGDKELTAYFYIDRHTVSVESSDDMWGTVSGGGVFDYGSPCTVYANSYTGYRFVSWSNGVTSSTYSFPVTQDISLTAIFAVDSGEVIYTVSASSADPSMGTVSGGGPYAEGSQAVLTAVANNGYRFTEWNDNDTTNPRTVVVTEDVAYVAYFEPLEAIDGVEEDGCAVMVVGQSIIVSTSSCRRVRIYDVTGRCLSDAQGLPNTPLSFTPSVAGVYMVQVDGEKPVKVVLMH